jgi:leader peptidase (prepilin peptidase)/N-methyltransferase
VAAADRAGTVSAVSRAQLLVLAPLLGLCVGSFLNVVIYRLPRGQSLVTPPSRCPKCGKGLSWVDNIPLLSWLVLRGRCRRCGEPISVQYPIVEAATAVAAFVVVLVTPPGPLLVSRLVLTAILIALFAIDLELQILPNRITVPGIAVGFVFSLFAPPGPIASGVGILLGGGVLYGIAAGYYLVRREEGMGMGDVKMLAMVGAFLGWRAVLLTLILASMAGAVIGLALMTSKKEGLRYALPFGTFLALAAFVSMLYGDALVNWYFGFMTASTTYSPEP